MKNKLDMFRSKNRWEALKLDGCGCIYHEWDETDQIWGVFGSESGFCYASFCSEEEAKEHAENLDEHLNGVYRGY